MSRVIDTIIMRDIKGIVIRGVVGMSVGAAMLAMGINHLALVSFTALALIAALLLPPALLALLLRVIKIRDRHAYFRLARPALAQAFPPAAFGNSSGGRNVS